MNPEEFRRLSTLFERACGLSEDARPAFIKVECAGSPELEDRLRRLLKIDAEPAHPLDLGPGAAAVHAAIEHLASSDPDASVPLPDHIGGYRIIRLLGSGGMGVVYEAEQEVPRRRVALKVMRLGMGSRQSRRRFEYESTLMARLQHPSIAHVYEAGWTGQGTSDHRPFFAMEYIDGGVAITEGAIQANLSIAERIEVFATACDAVHHGHQRGVIHRDLKPSNILLSNAGGQRTVKVIDFGVARLTAPDGHVATLETQVGQVIGTIQYMSPEQVGGNAAEIDARADVYSLGVVLFELLTSKLPYDLRGTTIAGAARLIGEREPSRLSRHDSNLRGDLETIVSKALAKDRDARYQSASELAADLRRYLADEPILARPATLIYTLRKAAARNRPATAAALVAALAVLVGSAASVWWAVDASRSRDAARDQAYRASLAAAGSALREGLIRDAANYLEAAPESLRGWEWRQLERGLDDSALQIDAGPLTTAEIRFGPDGTLAGVTCRDEQFRVRVWDLRTGRLIREHPVDAARRPRIDLAGGRALCPLKSGAIEEIDLATGKPLRRFELGGHFEAFLYTGEGPRIAARTASGASELVGADGSLRTPAARSPQPAGRSQWTTEDAAPDLGLILVTCASPQLAFRRQPDGTYLSTNWNAGDVRSVAFDPTGPRFAAVCSDGSIRLLDPETFQETGFGHVTPGVSGLESVDWSSDGQFLAVGSASGAVLIFDREGRPRTKLRGHANTVAAVRFSPDGARLAALATDGRLLIFERDRPSGWGGQGDGVIGRHAGAAELAVFTGAPGSQELISFGTDGLVRVWDPDHAKALREISTLKPGAALCAPFALVASDDGEKLLVGAQYPAAEIPDRLPPFFLMLLERRTLRVIATYRSRTPQERFHSATLSPDGRTALAWSYPPSGEMVLIRLTAADMTDPTPIAVPPPHERVAMGGRASFSPGGALACIPAPGNRLMLLDARTWTTSRILTLPECVTASAWWTPSPEGPRAHERPLLAVATLDGLIHLFDTVAWTDRIALQGHVAWITSLAFTPDGSRLFSASADGTIRIWDPHTGLERSSLRGHGGSVTSISLSPDGTRLFSSCGDGALRTWTAPLPQNHKPAE